MARPRPTTPGPGQESVWDYPRPPRLERVAKRLRVVVAGISIADTTSGFRVLETSHPPVYYIPAGDVTPGVLTENARTSYCEFKGTATYLDLTIGDRTIRDVAWTYRNPSARFAEIRDCVAFYASRVDECYVDDERVLAQAGDFYGGWITRDVVGPFKGEPGPWGW
jgi:uncharacterized protein (DUF427 family)